MLILQPEPGPDRGRRFIFYFTIILIHLLVDLKKVQNDNQPEATPQCSKGTWTPDPLSFHRFASEKPLFEKRWF
jgi:hypothetical protein